MNFLPIGVLCDLVEEYYPPVLECDVCCVKIRNGDGEFIVKKTFWIDDWYLENGDWNNNHKHLKGVDEHCICVDCSIVFCDECAYDSVSKFRGDWYCRDCYKVRTQIFLRDSKKYLTKNNKCFCIECNKYIKTSYIKTHNKKIHKNL